MATKTNILDQAKKLCYIKANFCVTCKAGKAVFITTNLNSAETGLNQCQQVLKTCGLQYKAARMPHALFEGQFVDGFEIVNA